VLQPLSYFLLDKREREREGVPSYSRRSSTKIWIISFQRWIKKKCVFLITISALLYIYNDSFFLSFEVLLNLFFIFEIGINPIYNNNLGQYRLFWCWCAISTITRPPQTFNYGPCRLLLPKLRVPCWFSLLSGVEKLRPRPGIELTTLDLSSQLVAFDFSAMVTPDNLNFLYLSPCCLIFTFWSDSISSLEFKIKCYFLTESFFIFSWKVASSSSSSSLFKMYSYWNHFGRP